MNLANKLTLFRMALAIVFMTFTVRDNLWTRVFALLIFIAAGLTDLYDGYFARKYGFVTNFGKFMDPLADKIMVSAAFVSFVSMKELQVPAWMVVLIISREFLVTGLRLDAASKGTVIPADRSGKFKTSSQVAVILAILVILCVNAVLSHFYHLSSFELLQKSGGPYWAGLFLTGASYWLVFACTLLTLISGLSYLYKNRHIFAEEIGLKSY